jgi:hypothetical protein
VLVLLVLGAEAPKFLVLGHESFDEVLLRHRIDLPGARRGTS